MSNIIVKRNVLIGLLQNLSLCFQLHTVHLDNYQRFFLPTDAQLNGLKNNFKFALKLQPFKYRLNFEHLL
jgi:hypothetical protein